MNANLASPWYAAGLRSIAGTLARLAARFAPPGTPSRPLEPRPLPFATDEYREEVRHRVAVGAQKLSRYY